MKGCRVLFVDNYDSFPCTIAAYFMMAGADVTMYKSDTRMGEIRKQAGNHNMILLGPGPSGPEQAGNYLEVIEEYHDKMPLFGVCLGHQALMHFFGERVEQLGEIVHGAESPVANDGKTIFEGIETPALFGRYHSLGVTKVPDCFEASATYDGIVMAARHKNLPIESVQFHPESILSYDNDAGQKLVENVVRLYGNGEKLLREGRSEI